MESDFSDERDGNATIPTQCMDPVAVDLLRFVPAANRPDGTYQAVPTHAAERGSIYGAL